MKEWLKGGTVMVVSLGLENEWDRWSSLDPADVFRDPKEMLRIPARPAAPPQLILQATEAKLQQYLSCTLPAAEVDSSSRWGLRLSSPQ